MSGKRAIMKRKTPYGNKVIIKNLVSFFFRFSLPLLSELADIGARLSIDVPK